MGEMPREMYSDSESRGPDGRRFLVVESLLSVMRWYLSVFCAVHLCFESSLDS